MLESFAGAEGGTLALLVLAIAFGFECVNWAKAGQVLLSLVVSPFLGFFVAWLALLAARRAFPSPELHAPAPTDRPPPLGVRALLVLA